MILLLLTGVQQKRILCVLRGHLSAFPAEMRCFEGEVSNSTAPEADLLDTPCVAGSYGRERSVPSSSRSVSLQPPTTVMGGDGAINYSARQRRSWPGAARMRRTRSSSIRHRSSRDSR